MSTILSTYWFVQLKRKKTSQILIPEKQDCVYAKRTHVLKGIHMSTASNFLSLFMLHPDSIARKLTKTIIPAEEAQK